MVTTTRSAPLGLCTWVQEGACTGSSRSGEEEGVGAATTTKRRQRQEARQRQCATGSALDRSDLRQQRAVGLGRAACERSPAGARDRQPHGPPRRARHQRWRSTLRARPSRRPCSGGRQGWPSANGRRGGWGRGVQQSNTVRRSLQAPWSRLAGGTGLWLACQACCRGPEDSHSPLFNAAVHHSHPCSSIRNPSALAGSPPPCPLAARTAGRPEPVQHRPRAPTTAMATPPRPAALPSTGAAAPPSAAACDAAAGERAALEELGRAFGR